MRRTLRKLLGSAFGSRLVASVIVAVGLAVIVVSFLVGTTAGWLVGAVLTVLGVVARAVVGPELETMVKHVRRRTLERRRTAVARLWDDDPPSDRPEHEELTRYLRERLLESRHNHALVILTGVDSDRLKAIAESAAAALRPSVEVIAPRGESPDDVRALAGWLVDGADEEQLPHDHEASTPTLFLLGDLGRYSGTGMAPSHFHRWRERPRLALATALRRGGATAAGSSWDNDLHRAARVIPILEEADVGGRSLV